LVGLSYEAVKPDVEEKPKPGEQPRGYVERLATEKGAWVAAEVARLKPRPAGYIVISADTIVVLGDDILEKPLDPADAKQMLGRLSGRVHTVYSGVSIASYGTATPRQERFVVTTEVKIKALSPKEIEAYIRTGEPLDKAGGYAAQGIGSYMVESINGSYANVVGLPIAEVVERLDRLFAYPIWKD
jgi:septum formation protein